jgi:hypothetical protein
MNSLKRDNSRRAVAESQLAENMARLVIVIAWVMSSFFNSHTPYILGLISYRREGERDVIAERGLQLRPAQDLLQQQVQTLACWRNSQFGKVAKLHEGFPHRGFPLL